MYQWEIDLAASMKKFQDEADELQDETYDEFLEILGLDHTEQLWNAFVLAWEAGEGVGQSREYSYPN